MNASSFPKGASRLPQQSNPKTPSQRNPPLKRKRADEPWQRNVHTKLTPANDVYVRRNSNPKFSSVSKIGPPSSLTPSVVKISTTVQVKTTFQTPMTHSSIKKDTVRARTPITARGTVKKSDGKVSASLEKEKPAERSAGRGSGISLSPVKKSLNVEHFEGLASVSKEVATEKVNLLSNLNNIVEELTEEHNPLLEENGDKLQYIQFAFERQKSHQREELEKLNFKINTLKDAQSSLSKLFEEKKERTLMAEQENQVMGSNIMKYNESIMQTKFHLNNLLKKNEDLNTFIYNVEEAIRTTKNKIRARYGDITSEEKKVLILTELIDERRNRSGFKTPQK